MKVTIFVTATGQVLRVVTLPVGMATAQLQEGEDWIEGEFSDDQFYIDGFTPVAIPTRPSENHAFNYATKQWEDPRTLADLKASKNAAINAARLKANQTHFTFMGEQIATDPLSRSDIDGAHGDWLTGQAPQDWPGGWKTIGNSYVPIPDQATWFAFYRAMVAQGTTNFLHAQALKSQLAAATNAEEVAAVPDW